MVHAIIQNGAAAKAGILPGDVIIGFNDKEITTFKELQNLIGQHQIGDVVKVKVWRDGEEFTLPVTLEPLPSE